MKDDNAKRLRANRVWLTADSCDLDAFKELVERTTNRADYPFARDVASNVPVYDGLEAGSAAASSETRKELMAEWVEALTDGPGHHRHPRRVRRPRGDRQGQCAFLGDHRRRALEQCRRRRSFRQAGRERPGLERAREAVPARPCRVCRLLRQCGDRARERSLARPRLSDHLAAQRRQSGRRGAGSPIVIIISASSRRRRSSAIPPTSTVSRRC